MSDPVPRLVKDTETGQICIQVSLGSRTATLPLPEHMAGDDREAIKAFMDEAVPAMLRGLRERQRAEGKKLMKGMRC